MLSQLQANYVVYKKNAPSNKIKILHFIQQTFIKFCLWN